MIDAEKNEEENPVTWRKQEFPHDWGMAYLSSDKMPSLHIILFSGFYQNQFSNFIELNEIKCIYGRVSSYRIMLFYGLPKCRETQEMW